MLSKSTKIIIETTSEIAREIGPFVHMLCEDSLDGQERRWGSGYWRYSRRPIIDNFAGNAFRLLIEGPTYEALGIRYPLGGQLSTKHGWTPTDPVETSLLVFQTRRAIDAVHGPWFAQHRSPESCTADPRDLNRENDDFMAIARMCERAAIVRQFMTGTSHA